MEEYEKIYFLVLKAVILVVMVTIILFYIFYIKTKMGFMSSYNGYTPFYAPFWLEILISIVVIPTFIGIVLYND